MNNPAIENTVGNPGTLRKPGRVGIMAIYLAFLAVFARTFTYEMTNDMLVLFISGEIGFLLIFSLLFWKPGMRWWLIHLCFVVECGIFLWLLSLWPDFDFLSALLVIVSYQAALFFRGRICWAWILMIVILTGSSLMYFHPVLEGLGFALTALAAEIVIPAYLLVKEETEVAKTRSQVLLNELDETNQQLQQYVEQVETLAAMQERNHLATTLHDSVSQMMFSIALTSRATESLLEKDPARARLEIIRLQSMTAEALSQLRSLITEMRPSRQ